MTEIRQEFKGIKNQSLGACCLRRRICQRDFMRKAGI